MYTINELANCGNVDFRQNPNEPLYGTKTIKNIQVPKLSWLRGCVNTYIEEYELGSGNFVPPKVYKDNKYIGYFSYNGKFWRKSNGS